ncbi:MAG: hypothetical protein KDE14_00150 [Rhodobacteraceae bacterium]|nr:hypothetical protein [Paracoccaceae bacterium]
MKFLRSAVLISAALCASAPVAIAEAPPNRTLGFTVTIWDFGIYETRFADECPAGMNPGYDEIWWRGLSKEERAEKTANGLNSRLDRYFNAIRRGPNGEDVAMNPFSVPPEPFLYAVGPKSYGFNLDGTTDGSATPKSCKHGKFEGADGTPAVDNQVFRLLGCIYGFRSYGQYQVNANENRKSNGLGMTLIEITDVDDTQNDPDVTMTFHRSIDQYTLDGRGQFVPFSSYRIDTENGVSRYGDSVKAKIVDGEIITDANDVRLPFYGNYTYMDQLLRDFRLKMKISEDGATAIGLAGGYYYLDQLMFYVCGVGPIASSGFSDCPSTYAAAREIADGYPDPETGKCTHLSGAFPFKAVAAFIIHPDQQSAEDSAK